MSDSELTKVEQLLDVIFDTNFKPDRNVEISQSVITDEEQSLDRSIQEAKNKLNTEQLEKNIERFRQGRRESNNNKYQTNYREVFIIQLIIQQLLYYMI